jgi:DNA-binding LacI/PurR family transcriptional regulator
VRKRATTLKDVAQYLGLAPATVSTVLNGDGGAGVGIAVETQKRIREAAQILGYRPSYLARALRTRRSYSVGVLVPEISQGYNVLVLRGIEDHLMKEGYFYSVASHHLRPDLVEDHAQRLIERASDGLIVVSAPWKLRLDIPVATISCHHAVKGTTRILLDHHGAAELALKHLTGLGHRRIAYIRGTPSVPDTAVRWSAIEQVAAREGVPVQSRLVTQIVDERPACPQLGSEVTRELLARGERFTALFAFNDVLAIGAIHALQQAGLRVPQDVSVLGFDDIESSTYLGPGLTTIRQPLHEMGVMAARAVLERIAGASTDWMEVAARTVVKPELVVRETTAAAREVGRRKAGR